MTDLPTPPHPAPRFDLVANLREQLASDAEGYANDADRLWVVAKRLVSGDAPGE